MFFDKFLSKLNHQWETPHKKTTCTAISNNLLHLLDVFAYFIAYIDLHTAFWETCWMSVRNWILLAILLCQPSHHQSCLIRSLLHRIYSSSWVEFNTQPFPFIQLRCSDLNCAKNIQRACNVYRFLQVHLAPFSAWNGFGVRSRGSIWQVGYERRVPLGLRGDLTRQGCDGTEKRFGKLKHFKVEKLFDCFIVVALVKTQEGANILHWTAFTQLQL